MSSILASLQCISIEKAHNINLLHLSSAAEVSIYRFFTRVLRISIVLTGLRTYEAILTDLLKFKLLFFLLIFL